MDRLGTTLALVALATGTACSDEQPVAPASPSPSPPALAPVELEGEVHEDELRDLAGRCFDRGASPDGFLRHFAAILADGDRASTLGGVDLPRLVVHGDEDTLIPLDCGVRTAQAMRAPLRIVRGMGHDLPPQRWDEIVGAISGLVPR